MGPVSDMHTVDKICDEEGRVEIELDVDVVREHEPHMDN